MCKLQSLMTTFENSTFKPIIEKWNTMNVDYFVYYKSSKCSRFNSKCLHLPIKVEDVFTQYRLNKACLNVSHLQPYPQICFKIWKYRDFNSTLLVMRQIWAFCHLKIKLNLQVLFWMWYIWRVQCSGKEILNERSLAQKFGLLTHVYIFILKIKMKYFMTH